VKTLRDMLDPCAMRIDVHLHFADTSATDPRVDQVIAMLHELKQGITRMSSTLSTSIDALKTDVTALSGAVDSSRALITGFATALAAAIASAATAGATPTELQSLSDLHTSITANTDALAQAVAANPIPAAPAAAA
jgi:hypothetical protein